MAYGRSMPSHDRPMFALALRLLATVMFSVMLLLVKLMNVLFTVGVIIQVSVFSKKYLLMLMVILLMNIILSLMCLQDSLSLKQTRKTVITEMLVRSWLTRLNR